jgi:predicted acyl esterase
MTEKPELSIEVLEFGKESIEVIYRKVQSPNTPEERMEFPKAAKVEFKPGTTTLPKGTVLIDKGVPLPCDIIWERDVGVTMRDGITIYTDILRPVGGTGLPAILSWSPYGKQLPQRAPIHVPADAISGLQKFEGPDPAYWCNHGYAVINPDARGAFYSEGDIHYWGTQEANDAYDLIEWLAAQKWCNGKVAMSGNSWLGIIQWFAASKKPPHLAAIAPWEGHIDLYRCDVRRGGIPDIGFNDRISSGMRGKNRVEDMAAMADKYPLMNGYWEDKSAKLEDITIPAYVVASWGVHHTIDGFRRMSSKEKWLRVHNTQEWLDYHTPENLEDLRRFFDRYLKGINNDWEKTPPVRLSVIDPGGTDQVNRPEKEWPLARTQYQKLYLDADAGTLSPHPAEKESLVRYTSDDGKGQATFTIKFDEDTELSGYLSLRLWVEPDGADDMDLFVLVQKLDARGNPPTAPFNYVGPDGRLRASHRQLDPERSTPWFPYHTHRSEERLRPGQTVPVDIPLRPTGMLWHAGEQLRLTIAGFDPCSLYREMHPGMPEPRTRNRGDHIIHTGGKYDSHLIMPVTPK